MEDFSRRTLIKQGLLAATTVALAPTLRASNATTLPLEEYRQWDALDIAERVRKGDVSAAEVLETAIARARAVNPTLNCIVETLYDRARAAVAKPLPAGPFHGVPFLLKDLGMMLEGTVTTHGSRFYRDNVADYTSTVVSRYQAAGLVIMGKTHSPEFGGTGSSESTLFGDTRNPWNLEHSAGGSSGGSAAAVAAGILPIANATDGGGSIRIPASACGLFGMKPSRGRVPHGPHTLSSLMSVTHAVSRSVRDSAALLDATHGRETGSRYVAPAPEGSFLEAVSRDPVPLKIALWRTAPNGTELSPEAVEGMEKTGRLLESLGHTVVEAAPTLDGEALGKAALFTICLLYTSPSPRD